MKTIKIGTAKICVPIILNDHLSNGAKAHSLLELLIFSPFMGQHVIDQKSTSSQARSRARPPFEPCERVAPKSYQRDGQPRKTENVLTNVGEDGSKPYPNPKSNPNTKPNPKKKRNEGKKLRKRKQKIRTFRIRTPKRTVSRTITQPTVPPGNSLQTT